MFSGAETGACKLGAFSLVFVGFCRQFQFLEDFRNAPPNEIEIITQPIGYNKMFASKSESQISGQEYADLSGLS